MGIYGYYAKWNKKSLLENKISALKKIIKQEGEKGAFYPLHKQELAEAEEKLKEIKRG